jgi:hypothetical protein
MSEVKTFDRIYRAILVPDEYQKKKISDLSRWFEDHKYLMIRKEGCVINEEFIRFSLPTKEELEMPIQLHNTILNILDYKQVEYMKIKTFKNVDKLELELRISDVCDFDRKNHMGVHTCLYPMASWHVIETGCSGSHFQSIGFTSLNQRLIDTVGNYDEFGDAMRKMKLIREVEQTLAINEIITAVIENDVKTVYFASVKEVLRSNKHKICIVCKTNNTEALKDRDYICEYCGFYNTIEETLKRRVKFAAWKPDRFRTLLRQSLKEIGVTLTFVSGLQITNTCPDCERTSKLYGSDFVCNYCGFTEKKWIVSAMNTSRRKPIYLDP